METAEESNKIIDLFMAEFEEHESDRLNIINDLLVKGHTPNRYDESWSCLMPVIAAMNFECRILDGAADQYESVVQTIEDAIWTDDISQAFEAVVEFIKWHNENNNDKS